MSFITSPFIQFPTIVTRRLRLRLFRPEDCQAIFAYKNRTEKTYFPRIEYHKDISESQFYIAQCLGKYYSRTGIYWAITQIPDDVVIGSVALCAMHGDSVIEYRAEISCSLSIDFRRKGIMTEARIAVINYAFNNWSSLNRIHSEIARENEPSYKMNLKLGFTEEGLLHSYQRGNDGKFSDIYMLSLLRCDWKVTPIYHNKEK